MRKLKLEMQVSVDGFAADSGGGVDWMVWNWTDPWTWDDDLRQLHTNILTSSDCLLLSRKMLEEGFIDHWSSFAVDPTKPQSTFARHVVNMRKLFFSRTLTSSNWDSVELVLEPLESAVEELKQQPGKDILVYGGPTLTSSLIEADLVDEVSLFVNPTALGSGRSMFKDLHRKANLSLVGASPYPCGVLVQKYVSRR